MLKEAIEKIEKMVKPDIVTVDGHTYAVSKDLQHEILPAVEMPETVQLNSLEAMAAMIRESNEFGRVYVDIPDHLTVRAFCPLGERGTRISPYKANATDVPGWDQVVKLPFDQAAVALQTRFQDSTDRDYTLQLLSQITTGAKVTYNDIGVATTVVTQRGVSLQQNSTIRPLVRLRPYRTFQEVGQPEGLFLIRIDERGITFTEADGGMWKLQARKTIKAYLQELLKDEIDAGFVVLML